MECKTVTQSDVVMHCKLSVCVRNFCVEWSSTILLQSKHHKNVIKNIVKEYPTHKCHAEQCMEWRKKFWSTFLNMHKNKTENLCLNRAMKLLKLCPSKLRATQILFPVDWEVTGWCYRWFHILEANGFFDSQLISLGWH
jgi:hypothetical protein